MLFAVLLASCHPMCMILPARSPSIKKQHNGCAMRVVCLNRVAAASGGQLGAAVAFCGAEQCKGGPGSRGDAAADEPAEHSQHVWQHPAHHRRPAEVPVRRPQPGQLPFAAFGAFIATFLLSCKTCVSYDWVLLSTHRQYSTLLWHREAECHVVIWRCCCSSTP